MAQPGWISGALGLLSLVAVGCSDERSALLPASDASSAPRADADPPRPLRVQLFSRTSGYRHDAIEPAQRVLARGASARGELLRMTEDPGALADALGDSDVVVFLLTTGDVLDDVQQQAFEAYVRAGGGFVGVHSASDTEYDWPFYGELIGAWFASHTAVLPGRVIVEASTHPTAAAIPDPWQLAEEWYDFKENPRERPGTEIVLRADETSYEGGKMGSDHPIAWARELDAGRAYYTGLGHPVESWQDPVLVAHVEAAIRWAAHR